jgi:hypothetical protein
MATERWPTSQARMALGARFNLPYDDSMQDWEWQVADPARLSEFLGAYSSGQLTDDERFSLMEVMVQCVEEISPEAPFQAAWAALEPLLATNAALHRTTVEYWARLDTNEEEEMWRVSPNMCRLYMSWSEAANDI